MIPRGPSNISYSAILLDMGFMAPYFDAGNSRDVARATTDLPSLVPLGLVSSTGLDSKSSGTFPKRSCQTTLRKQMSARDELFHSSTGWIRSQEQGQQKSYNTPVLIW